jgi:hypothetical protein
MAELGHLQRICHPLYLPMEEDFLPELWEALEYSRSNQARHDRLWKRDASLAENLLSIVEVIRTLLPAALHWGTDLGCKTFILRLVKRCKYVYTERRTERRRIRSSRRGYVHLTLFYRVPHHQVRISAHRFMLWAMLGMPPNEHSCYALHTCPGGEDSACVARTHLRWGSAADNARDRDRAAGRYRYWT